MIYPLAAMMVPVAAYFFVTTLVGSVSGTLVMPYFKSTASLGVVAYTYVMGCGVLGRLIDGMVHLIYNRDA